MSVELRAAVSAHVPRWLRRAVRTAVDASYGQTTRSLRLMPSFLIIGAQRSGTTSLYKYLVRHPLVGSVLLGKGVHYFDVNYDRGLGWYRAHFPTRLTARLASARHGGEMITGEGSPYYVFHPLAPERIVRTLPDAKLILLLRDPVARALSHYEHEVARGFEELSFEEALDREEERLAGEAERILQDPSCHSFEHQHHSYAARGMYADQVERWFELVAGERLLVLQAERFFADPGAGLAEVLQFLDLPPWSLSSFPAHNAREYDAMRPETRRRLAGVFSEPNRRLAGLLGTEVWWSE